MELKKVDIHNVWDIVKLEVQENQKSFVATNTQSILEAYCTLSNGGVALPFGIYQEEQLIGFVMLSYGTLDEDDPAFTKDSYCIWRFMIDHKYQGKGYGKQALKEILTYIKSAPCGKTTTCWLSYEAENVGAKHLYNAVGFVENGEVCDKEIVAILNFS